MVNEKRQKEVMFTLVMVGKGWSEEAHSVTPESLARSLVFLDEPFAHLPGKMCAGEKRIGGRREREGDQVTRSVRVINDLFQTQSLQQLILTQSEKRWSE